jgi:hypothetical protein
MRHERRGKALQEDMRGMPEAGLRSEGLGMGGLVQAPELGIRR